MRQRERKNTGMTTDLLFPVFSVALFDIMMELPVTTAHHNKGRIPASLLTFLFPVFPVADNHIVKQFNATEAQRDREKGRIPA
jgi:hypothetical protein